MNTESVVQDPSKAKAFFEEKMAFTTGPVELSHEIEAGSNNINIIDVRAEEDYLKGHIPGAINLPREKWETLQGLSKDKTNVVYCYTHVCHLAAAACVIFASNGFRVKEMDGGFEAWKENDLDIERPGVNRMLKSKTDKLLHRRH